MADKYRRTSLFRNAVAIISECIEHLHDEDLSLPEVKARELLVSYCDLLVKRWSDPNYGKESNQ